LTTPYILAVACVCVSLLTAILRVMDHRRQSFATKCVACVLFMLTAAFAAGQQAQPMDTPAKLMLAGLALGFVGDVFLGLAPLVPKEKNGLFSALGGVPFFVGHFFFVAALLPGIPLRWPLLLLLPLLPALFLLLQKANVFDLGKRLIPIMIYGLVLGAMMLASINYAAHIADGPLGELPIGLLMWLSGILFAVSDTSLFLRGFGKEKLARFVPVFEFTVMLPYFAAQAIFALAVAYV